jgi:hypothetical protein
VPRRNCPWSVTTGLEVILVNVIGWLRPVLANDRMIVNKKIFVLILCFGFLTRGLTEHLSISFNKRSIGFSRKMVVISALNP